MDGARGWRGRDVKCKTQSKIQNPFESSEKMCVMSSKL